MYRDEDGLLKKLKEEIFNAKMNFYQGENSMYF